MSEAERLHFLDVIEAEVGRLDRLTRRLLDLARADMTAGSGRGPTQVGPVLAAVAARLNDRDLCIRVEGDAEVAIDREPLESIVAGLLDNVMAHGGSTVAIDVMDQGSDVLIRVSDNGPGISAANAPKIFDAFFTTTREQGGTGLGLPIIQAFAAGVGGSIRLLPMRPGATFEVRLPARR
ncbi:MAG: HAMP domain-containing histidine kinase [Alphaproteobacteria bacterium]|nr:MAG: HAMP domain-containing histidine kinase [Alphaproteobacteria bacterium]